MHELKSHLTYQGQISLLEERGLGFSNYLQVLQVLKNIGYYRFSAYTYPFRIPLFNSSGEQIGRADQFVSGAKFEDALRLYNFDSKLRSLLQNGLEPIEVAIGSQVGYVLGSRGTQAHLDTQNLDQDSCQIVESWKGGTQTNYERWLDKILKLQQQASFEDFVKHHKAAYGNRFPVWVITEFMDFGSVTMLYQFLKKEDRIAIAEHFGIKNDQSGIFSSWIQAMNVLRNNCAHNNRIWNRIGRSPKKPPVAIVSKDIWHIGSMSDSDSKKLYPLVAIISYLLAEIGNATDWRNEAVNLFKQFGDIQGMTLEKTMGFPEKWQKLSLWH